MKSRNIAGKRFEFEKEFIKSPETLGPYVLHQMGEIFCEPGYSCEPHIQWCFEISYVVSGKGLSIINGNEIPVSTGDVFLTPLGCTHVVTAITEFRYQFVGFDFSLAASNEDFEELKAFYKSSPTNTIKGKQDIVTAFSKCLDEYYNSLPGFKLMVQGFMTHLFTQVYRLFTTTKNIRYLADDTINYVGLSLYSVILFIETNIHTVRDVNTVAQSLNYNPSYLSRMFKNQMGLTLQQYLSNRRIEESINIVKQTRCSFADVAQKLGFSSPQTFSRAFKRVKGMSPKEYFERYEEV